MTAPQPHAPAVHRYFARAVDPDREAYLAQFAADAVVEDEGREHHGADEIRAWRGEIRRSFTTSSTWPPSRVGCGRSPASGGDFPGSPVDLAFEFGHDDDGRIRRLVIRPTCDAGADAVPGRRADRLTAGPADRRQPSSR